MDPSPALRLRFPSGTTAPLRERLVALLADHDLLAIQEDDVDLPEVWVAHFETPSARDTAAAGVEAEPEFALIEAQKIQIDDEDWARRTQAGLPAVQIGRVTIAPPWDLPDGMRDVGRGVRTDSVNSDAHPATRIPDPDDPDLHPPSRTPHPGNIVVMIEPSRGFGTGHHESTRLCIVLLQARNLSGLTVTDVGTGSGVLAITAAKLGAAFVAAIDNDHDAIDNARENIKANGLDSIVEAHVDDLATTTVPAADVVTANLTGSLLARHPHHLARLVRPGGSLIVSGFNRDENDRVAEALSTHFSISESAEEEDWCAFVVTRHPVPPSTV